MGAYPYNEVNFDDGRAMKRIWVAVVTLSAVLLFGGNQTSHAEQGTIDLSQLTPPDIGVVGDDPFGKLVKYGHELFTNTANEIGPAVADVSMRLAGNNLACQNCHRWERLRRRSLDLAPAIGPDDLANKPKLHANTAVGFVGAEGVGQ